jgi:ATP-binding cassette, subfamily B (MDR/TAP), member 1
LQSVATAGTIAEEVISTIRTAQAFGTQEVLSQKYNEPIGRARVAGLKGAMWRGGGLAVFFFVLYAGYALGK